MEELAATSVRGKLQFCKPEVDGSSTDSQSQSLSPLVLLRKLFESQTGDWEMVSSDGEAYKFHQLVLNEQVARFRTIFAHPDTREHSSKQIVVPPEVEMSGPAVEAFLRYAYYQDTAPMKSSFDIAVALVRAGHYYDIPKMVDAANDALHFNGVRQRKLEWLKFEESWELFKNVRLWEKDHPSKNKLMKILAAIMKEFSDSNAAPGSVTNESEPLIDLIRLIDY